MTDRIAGAIYGHLVGDALGVPYEFTRDFTRDIETVDWRGHGIHDQPAGTWSDDGALMLALDSLLDAGFDTAHQARRFQDCSRLANKAGQWHRCSAPGTSETRASLGACGRAWRWRSPSG